MKKTLITIVLIALSLSAFSQTRARTGITIGNHTTSGTNVSTLDSITLESGALHIYNGATDLALGIIASDTAAMLTNYITTSESRDVVADSLNALRNSAVLGSSLYVKLLADTTYDDTAIDTLSLTEAGRIVRYNFATQTKVYVPLNATVAFPIKTVINIKMDGAGIVGILPCAGVVIQSELDSCYINNQHGWATLIKRATDKWDLLGSLKD